MRDEALNHRDPSNAQDEIQFERHRSHNRPFQVHKRLNFPSLGYRSSHFSDTCQRNKLDRNEHDSNVERMKEHNCSYFELHEENDCIWLVPCHSHRNTTTSFSKILFRMSAAMFDACFYAFISYAFHDMISEVKHLCDGYPTA